MMRVLDLLSQALLVSRRDQQQAQGRPSAAPGLMPIDHLSQPLPKFMPRGNHSYDAVLEPSVDSAFRSQQWGKDPTQNAREFNAAMQGSRFRTLAEMIDTVVPNCGVTKTSGKRVNVTGMSTMVWQNDKEHEGFTHHGPCEAWIDRTRVYQSPNCRVDHAKYPATIPIDYSVCEGNCIFTFYWLSVDEPEWHAYKQCVPITTGRKFMKPKKLIVVSTIAPTQTPAPTSTNMSVQTPVPTKAFVPAHTPAPTKTFMPAHAPTISGKRNATISNAHVEAKHHAKHGASRDSRDDSDDKKGRHDSDDSDDDRDSDDSDDDRHSDDSDDDRNSDDDDSDDHHHRRRRRDSDGKHHGDSDDKGDSNNSDDSQDETKDSDVSRDDRGHAHHHSHFHHSNRHPAHRDDPHRTLPPPTYSFYPMSKSMIVPQSYQQHEQTKHQHHSDGSNDNDNCCDHVQYQRAPNGYPKHRDNASRTPPPPPSDNKYPTDTAPVVVRQARQQPEQNKAEQDSAMGTAQPIYRLNRLDQNNY